MSRYDEIIAEHYGINVIELTREKQKQESKAFYEPKLHELEEKVAHLSKLLADHGIQDTASQ